MAESNVPVQPASQQPQPAPVAIKTFTAIDLSGNLVQIQGISISDSQDRENVLMSDNTGQQILAAIKALHQTIVEQNGGLSPLASSSFSD